MDKYPESGVYLLYIKTKENIEIEVGALGEIKFPAGKYFYAGTAQKNLAARIKRHYSSEKKLHWHIDYLLQKADILDDFIFEFPREGECFLADLLKNKGGKIKAAGFGASDCSCGSHLIYFDETHKEEFFYDILKKEKLTKEFKKFKMRSD